MHSRAYVQPFRDQTFDFQIVVDDDSAALTAADTYAVTVKQAGVTLASFSGPAPYETSFANSAQCDPFACRSALIDLR